MKISIITGFLLSTFVLFLTPASAEARDIKGAKDYFLHGDKNSSTKVVTYVDFECSFCNKFHSTLEILINKYKNEDVAFSYRPFPMTQINSDAFEAVIAFECLNKIKSKKKNLEFSSIIFDSLHSKNSVKFDLDEIVKSTKVNKNKFSRCMVDKKVRASIEKTTNEYISKIATVDSNFGTPYTVVTKGSSIIPIPGAQSFEVVDPVIDEFVSNKKAKYQNIANEYEAKGKDAAIKALLSNFRAQAELHYDDNNGSYKKACSALKEYSKGYGSGDKIKFSCKDASDKYAVESKLSDNKHFCVDSTGFAGALNKSKGSKSPSCND